MSSKSAPPDRLSESRVGSLLGERYRIDALLDEGAMGRVYRGEHVAMRKRVAIKILRRELTRVPEVLARFEREAMAAANINHQHIAAATDFGRLEDGSVFLVLEYVEGRTLRSELSRGPLSVHRALSIVEQMAEALAAAHELDIVHRDLKPENVMLLERGDTTDFVKVLDFGVAKVPVDMAEPDAARSDTGSLITKAGMIFGTPDYMAPEQALGQAVDYRADLYSLGVILFELLTGVRPFRSDHELGVLGQQLSKGVPPMAQRAPGCQVPGAVESFVRSLMVNEVSGRLQSAAQVALSLAELQKQVPDALPSLASAPTARPTLGASPDLGLQVQGTQGSSAPGLSTSIKRVAFAAVSAFPEMREAAKASVRDGAVHSWRRVQAFHKGLPEPLCLMPLWVLLGVPSLFTLGALALTLALGASDPEVIPSERTAHGTSAPSAPVLTASVRATLRAPAHERAEALKQGANATEALAQRYPADPDVQLALARAHLKTRKYPAALAAIENALKLDESLKHEGLVTEVVNATVRFPATEQRTLNLLKGAMGAVGADLILELATAPQVAPSLQRQAFAWLKTRAFEKVSTPEASVAAALVLAPSCRTRQALSKRAENVGDARSLRLLKRFARAQGCTPEETEPCNACLKGDAELTSAITTLSKKFATK